MSGLMTRRSELWRKLEAVQAGIDDERAQRDRALALARTWDLLPEHVQRAQHWRAVAKAHAGEVRTLLRARTALVVKMAIQQPSPLSTTGERIEQHGNGGVRWR